MFQSSLVLPLSQLSDRDMLTNAITFGVDGSTWAPKLQDFDSKAHTCVRWTLCLDYLSDRDIRQQGTGSEAKTNSKISALSLLPLHSWIPESFLKQLHAPSWRPERGWSFPELKPTVNAYWDTCECCKVLKESCGTKCFLMKKKAALNQNCTHGLGGSGPAWTRTQWPNPTESRVKPKFLQWIYSF